MVIHSAQWHFPSFIALVYLVSVVIAFIFIPTIHTVISIFFPSVHFKVFHCLFVRTSAPLLIFLRWANFSVSRLNNQLVQQAVLLLQDPFSLNLFQLLGGFVAFSSKSLCLTVSVLPFDAFLKKSFCWDLISFLLH